MIVVVIEANVECADVDEKYAEACNYGCVEGEAESRRV
jgi:hypothetical protein